MSEFIRLGWKTCWCHSAASERNSYCLHCRKQRWRRFRTTCQLAWLWLSSEEELSTQSNILHVCDQSDQSFGTRSRCHRTQVITALKRKRSTTSFTFQRFSDKLVSVVCCFAHYILACLYRTTHGQTWSVIRSSRIIDSAIGNCWQRWSDQHWSTRTSWYPRRRSARGSSSTLGATRSRTLTVDQSMRTRTRNPRETEGKHRSMATETSTWFAVGRSERFSQRWSLDQTFFFFF